MAEAVVKGAKEGGAEVRLRRVAELAPEKVIRQQDAWREHYEATLPLVAVVTLDDLKWADGFAFGTPIRFGLPPAQLKEFIDQTGPLWVQGHLANKVATSFTSSENAHGGQESTLLALNNVSYHWGCLIVPPATPTRSLRRPAAIPTARRTQREQATRSAQMPLPRRTPRVPPRPIRCGWSRRWDGPQNHEMER